MMVPIPESILAAVGSSHRIPTVRLALKAHTSGPVPHKLGRSGDHLEFLNSRELGFRVSAMYSHEPECRSTVMKV